MLTTRSLGLLDHHQNLRLYKNKYSDRRCFIVGCGPTAKEFDVLRDTEPDDIVIALKSAVTFPGMVERTDYLFVGDAFLWRSRFDDTERKRFEGIWPQVAANDRIKVFMTAGMNREWMWTGGIDDHYWNDLEDPDSGGPDDYLSRVDQLLTMTTHADEIHPDLDRHPVFNYSISSAAFQVALYMGCPEIILVGQDCTKPAERATFFHAWDVGHIEEVPNDWGLYVWLQLKFEYLNVYYQDRLVKVLRPKALHGVFDTYVSEYQTQDGPRVDHSSRAESQAAAV